MDGGKVPSTSELQSPQPRGRHRRPHTQGQRTPEPVLEEIRIHDKQKGKGAVGGHGRDRGDDKRIQRPRQYHSRSRFTPGNLWPCHPAPEIYLLPVTHGHLLSCVLPLYVFSATHSVGIHRVGLPVSYGDTRTPQIQAALLNFPAASTSLGTGSFADWPWAPKGEETGGGAGAPAPGCLENPSETYNGVCVHVCTRVRARDTQMWDPG